MSSPVSTASVFPLLEAKLPSVQKPIQYVGGELNSVVKDWDCAPDGDDGALGTDVSRRLRGRPAQPGRPDPLRSAQRARLDRRRAHLLGVAGHGEGDAHRRRGGIPQFTVDSPPAGRRLRPLRPELLDRARLHQHAQRPRPRGHPAARGRPRRGSPGRDRGRSRRVQPRADRRLHRRRGARRRRGGRARHLRGRPRVEGRGQARRSRRAAAPPRGQRRRLRPEVLRRRLRRRRLDRGRRAQPSRHPVPGPQAHADGPRPVALPGQPAGAAGRDRARALLRRDLPRLHARLPLLPGRHDHPPGARAVHQDHRRHGRERHPQDRLRGGRPAVAVQRRPHRDRRGRQGPGRPLRGLQRLALAAEHPRGRLQHHPGQRVLPQRPSLGPHLRPRGRLGADAQGDQQDGHRGGPDPHRRRGLLPRLAPGEALLHGRPADRDRRGRPPGRRAGQEGHRQGPRGHRPQRHPLHGLDRRLRAQAAHAVPVGRPARPRDDRRAASRSCATPSATTSATAGRSASATTTASPASSRDCCRAATAASAG